MKTQRKNLRKVYRQADRVDLREGMLAYKRYRRTMEELADFWEFPIESAVAAFCALSPNNDYIKNLRSCATVLWGYRNQYPVELLTVSTYNACKYRAWNFVSGVDFLSVTRGLKTRNFYINLLNPDDRHAVTIDGHMIGCWHGLRMTMKEAVYMRANYNEIAEDFRVTAKRLGILPCQLQAVLWFTWKRIKRVVYTPQLYLFEQNNQWRNYIHPADIKPYPLKTEEKKSKQKEPRLQYATLWD